MTELKNATCELKGEYKMSGDANKVDFWVHFEGKTHGDKIDWQTYSPNPDYTSLKSAPFILGQEYNYWVWGQFGEVGEQPNHGIDGWTSGTEEITNGGKEAVLFESVHPGHLGHETGAGAWTRGARAGAGEVAPATRASPAGTCARTWR